VLSCLTAQSIPAGGGRGSRRVFASCQEDIPVNRTEKKFLETVRTRDLAGKNDRVLIAVSGGPDSMALLHLFHAAMPVLHIRIGVAHCNFRLRGAESDSDESFVRAACEELGVDCFVKGFDTQDLSVLWKKSIEETARILRYGFFSELLREQRFSRVATGHHVNDNAETILFNLFRGTSVPALKGIRTRHGSIVRPLLLFHKKEILDYLLEKGIAYRTDSSNLCIDHDRNFIRNRVIPLIEERFKSKLMPSLQRMSEHAAELEEFLELHFDNLVASRPGLSPDGGSIDIRELHALTLFERKEILKRALREFDAKVDARVLQRLVDLLERQSGRSVPLSSALLVVRDGDLLRFVVRGAGSAGEGDRVIPEVNSGS